MSTSELVNPLIVRALTVQEFTAARSAEIHSLVDASSSERTRVVKHLRRRAVSHNPRQRQLSRHQIQKQRNEDVVTSLRGAGTGENANSKKGNSTTTKIETTAKTTKPCRRARRRACRLVGDCGTEVHADTKVRRLETHIWHAKRMHMKIKWGCYIGDRNAQRGEKAAHRDVLKHCAMLDASYLRCLEVSGCVCAINRTIQSKPRNCGSGQAQGALYTTTCLTDKAYTDSPVEGHTTLYNEVGYRCDVSFAWKTSTIETRPEGELATESCSHESRAIWLWIHPRDYDELLGRLTAAVSSASLTDTPMTLIDRTSELGRISLIGPNAAQILASVLHTGNFTDSQDTDESNTKALIDQLRRAADQSITPLNVVDPRFYRHATHDPGSSTASTAVPEEIPNIGADLAPMDKQEGCLYDDEYRRIASVCRVSDRHFNAARSQYAIDRYRTLREHIAIAQKDGIQTDIYAEKFPVLVVKRSGVQRSVACRTRGARRNKGYGAGYDLVFPYGYGMPFWMALIYSGAHAFGQDLLRRLCLECNLPVLAPFDTTLENVLSHLRSALNSPIDTDTEAAEADHTIMDDDTENSSILTLCADFSKLMLANSYIQQGCLSAAKLALSAIVMEEDTKPCDVIAVAVDMMHKGTPKANYLLYAPSAHDYTAYTRDKHSCTFTANNSSSSSTRPVLGMVSIGGYSHVRACGSGIAYVSLQRLKLWGTTGSTYDFPAFVLVGECAGLSPLRPAYISVIMTQMGST